MIMPANFCANASSIPYNAEAMDSMASDHVDKRKVERNKKANKVRCTYYDVLLDDFIVFDTHLIDLSEHGLSFLSENHLRPDTPVYIKFLKSISDAKDDAFSQGRHGQVIYCAKEYNKNEAKRYRIGIEFFDVN